MCECLEFHSKGYLRYCELQEFLIVFVNDLEEFVVMAVFVVLQLELDAESQSDDKDMCLDYERNDEVSILSEGVF